MSTLEGKLVANNMKVGIVVARFNEFSLRFPHYTVLPAR